MRIFQEYFSILKQLFIPDEMCEKIEDVVLDSLYFKGYKTILLDVDNTLLTYDQRIVTLQKLNWINRYKNLGFNIFLLSNNIRFNRLKHICEQINIPIGMYFALKPLSYSVRDLAYKYQFDLRKTIIIGDQLFTDVLLGNWVRSYTILIDPVDKKLSFFKTVQREIEFFLLKKISSL